MLPLLIMRFFLELLALLGLLASVFVKHLKIEKILFSLLAIFFYLVWSRYGAPKSPLVLTGLKRLMLEFSIFTVSSLCFMRIYSFKIGLIYLIFSVGNLIILYSLGL